jgi:hypothetical protein
MVTDVLVVEIEIEILPPFIYLLHLRKKKVFQISPSSYVRDHALLLVRVAAFTAALFSVACLTPSVPSRYVSAAERGCVTCVRERERAILSVLTAAFPAVFTWANEGTPGIKTYVEIK